MCDCSICVEARERGAPYARRGYGLFLHDVNGLIDAAESAPANLTRWGIDELEYVFLTHWHPDHTHGLRVLSMRPTETREGETFVDAKRRTAPTVVTTRAVYERTVEAVSALEFFVSKGYADVHFLDDEPLYANGVRVSALPYPLEPDGPPEATGFLFEQDETSLAVVADDARHFVEETLPSDLDVAVFESGHFTHGPEGTRIRSPELETDDLAHEEVLDRVRRVDPERAYLSHFGHHYRRGHDDYRRLAERYRKDADVPDGVQFAHDGLTVDL
jgi:phosphoribosyl 1,2-cyclic phosphate phosphodiesterase